MVAFVLDGMILISMKSFFLLKNNVYFIISFAGHAILFLFVIVLILFPGICKFKFDHLM